jgi:predicted nucleotidyltransferase
MAATFFVEIEQFLRELCGDRAIPVDSLRFFGSRTQGSARKDESDVDLVLVSPAFEGKDIFQRTAMTKGMHRSLVKRFKVPFDIVYCSSGEWEQGRSPLLYAIKHLRGY